MGRRKNEVKRDIKTKGTNVNSCGGGAVVGSAGRDAPVGWLALATRLESATAGPSRGAALVPNGLRCTPRNELTVFPAQQAISPIPGPGPSSPHSPLSTPPTTNLFLRSLSPNWSCPRFCDCVLIGALWPFNCDGGVVRLSLSAAFGAGQGTSVL